MKDMLQHPRCVALGKIGFDAYHAQSLKDQDRQLDALHLVQVSHIHPKPVVFHCQVNGKVDPFDPLLQVAEQYLPDNKKKNTFIVSRVVICKPVGGCTGSQIPNLVLQEWWPRTPPFSR